MFLSKLGYSELVQRLFEKMTFSLVDPIVQVQLNFDFASLVTLDPPGVTDLCVEFYIQLRVPMT